MLVKRDLLDLFCLAVGFTEARLCSHARSKFSSQWSGLFPLSPPPHPRPFSNTSALWVSIYTHGSPKRRGISEEGESDVLSSLAKAAQGRGTRGLPEGTAFLSPPREAGGRGCTALLLRPVSETGPAANPVPVTARSARLSVWGVAAHLYPVRGFPLLTSVRVGETWNGS